MIHPKLSYHQSGVALVLSLLLLFILTLVAVSSFTSSHVQERAASNSRLQTMAFEAAAAGAANSIDFFMSNVVADAPDTLCGQKDHTGWADPTPWQPVTYATSGVNLKQRMYCLNDVYPDPGGGRPPRSQLFVASRGEVEANGSVVAFREVEVRIASREDIDAKGCGALCFAACSPLYDGDDPLIDFPSSNVFQVDGGGGPAVTTSEDCDNPTLLDTILDDLNSNRLGNYDGGLHERDPGSPWNDPTETDLYRAAVETAAQVAPNTYVDGNLVDMGNTVYGALPPDGTPEIVYVTGDLEFGGGISGAGIIMVEGNIYWNGTPDYKGLIVTLGGTYTIDGGGTGGNHAGSVVILNNNGQSGCAAANSCTEFGGVSFENTGGGTAEYTWDCGALEMAYGLVDDGVADNDDTPWGFECDGRQTLFEVPDSLIIASWRENIGWRENYFAE